MNNTAMLPVVCTAISVFKVVQREARRTVVTSHVRLLCHIDNCNKDDL